MPKLKESDAIANAKIYIRFAPKELSNFGRIKISMRDLQDRYNETSMFTTKVRHVEDAWLEIKSQFTEETTWSDVVRILNKHNVEYHQYCAMD